MQQDEGSPFEAHLVLIVGLRADGRAVGSENALGISFGLKVMIS